MSVQLQPRRAAAAVSGLAALALALSACGGEAETADATASPSVAEVAPAQALVLEDAWAKAGDGMTSAFGTLHNPGTEPVTVTGGSSPQAGRVELHTMENQNGALVMTLDEDGFQVPAGGTHELAPGGDHIMLIELTEPLASGTEVTVVLTTEEGTESTFNVPVREFSGAEEDYLPGSGHDSHDSDEHADATGPGTGAPTGQRAGH